MRGMLVNIGIFTDTYYPQVSGVATSIKTLREQLERQGHNVYIFTTTDPGVDKNIYERNVLLIKISMNVTYFDLQVFRLFHLQIEELQFGVLIERYMLPKP